MGKPVPQTNQTTTKKLSLRESHLKTIAENITTMLSKKSEALPKNFNNTRFLQNCMTVLQETKDIEKYHPLSVARTMMKGALLGLDFFNNECFAVPYGNQLKFQKSYSGVRKLALEHSTKPIDNIYAKNVRKGDVFSYGILDGKDYMDFKPIPFNDAEIVGTFGVIHFTDGLMICETMSISEIDQIRINYSKVPTGQAWKNSLGEMCIKTMIHRLKKRFSLSFDNVEQERAFYDDEKIEDIENVPAVQDPFAGNAESQPQNIGMEDAQIREESPSEKTAWEEEGEPQCEMFDKEESAANKGAGETPPIDQ